MAAAINVDRLVFLIFLFKKKNKKKTKKARVLSHNNIALLINDRLYSLSHNKSFMRIKKLDLNSNFDNVFTMETYYRTVRQIYIRPEKKSPETSLAAPALPLPFPGSLISSASALRPSSLSNFFYF